MEYYYDIYLNYNDYPINYYEWSDNDNLEHFNRLPIIKVDDIKEFVLKEAKINIDYKNAIISDGINAIAIEVINNKIVYLSYLSFKDENRVNEIALDMLDTELDIEFLGNRIIPSTLRSVEIIKEKLIKKINEDNKYFLKYLYFEVFKKDSNNLVKIKKSLLKDINNNFDEKYIKLCDIIYE